MRKNEEEQGTMILRYGKNVLMGGGIAFLFSLLFLLVVSIGISRGLLEAGLRYQLTVVSCILGGFLGGCFAVKQCKGQSLIIGLAAGGILFLLQLSIGLLIYDTLSFENGGLGLLCGALCGGAAAGILMRGKRGGSRGKKRRKR